MAFKKKAFTSLFSSCALEVSYFNCEDYPKYNGFLTSFLLVTILLFRPLPSMFFLNSFIRFTLFSEPKVNETSF